jgi:hypothetical protein
MSDESGKLNTCSLYRIFHGVIVSPSELKMQPTIHLQILFTYHQSKLHYEILYALSGLLKSILSFTNVQLFC